MRPSRSRLPRLFAALACAFALIGCMPAVASADATGAKPIYTSLEQLKGKRIAYVNGSVYNQAMQKKVEGTSEQFYASIADCVKAVETDKADAAVQLSYCLELAENRREGSVALLPENLGEVEEAFFFPHGDPLVEKFNDIIQRYESDGTIDQLKAKWVGTDESAKTIPAQDWDAPNGTLSFATSGVLEPYSYVGAGGEALGYDVDLALHIAKDLGYRLNVSTIPMDSIFAAVQSHKVDFGGTLTNTAERAQVVDFSRKVMPSYISVIAKADGSSAGGGLEFNSAKELDGHKVGVLNGSITDRFVDAAIGGSRDYTYLNTTGDMVASLKAGKIDAFCADEPVALLAVSNNEGIGAINEKVADDKYGLIFPKGSPLKAEFDTVIEEFRADGTLDALKKKWTGPSDAEKILLPVSIKQAPKVTLELVSSYIFIHCVTWQIRCDFKAGDDNVTITPVGDGLKVSVTKEGVDYVATWKDTLSFVVDDLSLVDSKQASITDFRYDYEKNGGEYDYYGNHVAWTHEITRLSSNAPVVMDQSGFWHIKDDNLDYYNNQTVHYDKFKEDYYGPYIEKTFVNETSEALKGSSVSIGPNFKKK